MEKNQIKDARLVARVSVDTHSLIHRAASYSGATVSQFLVDTVLEKAKKVIKEVEVIKISEMAAKEMMELMNNPPQPTEYMLRAKANYRDNIDNEKNRALRKKAQKK